MQPSTYLQYLPEIYRADPVTGQFLKVFEKILTGIDDDVPTDRDIKGIEQILDEIVEYFDASNTGAPLEFLEWLAYWVALDLPEDWSEEVKRNLIPKMVQLYKKRGTKEGLLEFLNIYSGASVTIDEWYSPFQLGKTSIVGTGSALGGGPPGFFTVKVVLAQPDIQLKSKTEQVLRTIIDREKPAHTYYRLDVIIPTFQVGVHSTVGKDTIVK
jgi:phage tail-like protein